MHLRSEDVTFFWILWIVNRLALTESFESVSSWLEKRSNRIFIVIYEPFEKNQLV